VARLTTMQSVDEEALGERFESRARRKGGIYFTPSWLVQQVLEAVAPFVPEQGALAIVDPACGAGAFLAAAAERFPRAQLFGCELQPGSAAECRTRVPKAKVIEGDALRGPALEKLLKPIRPGTFELWLGNPPYNGRSALLDDPKAFARMQKLLVPEAELAKGQSLRDDFAFFLLVAAQRLAGRDGALAFVTSASLLDAFLYSPLRQTLLSRLALREAVDLGVGVFRGTKVRTCFTVWTTNREGPVVSAAPPQYRLRKVSEEANALHQAWRREGALLTELIPVSLPGLKTRFDELLTDSDPERLRKRLAELMRTPKSKLSAFAKKHEIPKSCASKLAALPTGLTIDPAKVRAFIRYRGALSRGPSAFCYLDRELIPRGDHRLHGEWDPHQGRCKLVFNIRELPLWAELLEEAGCVTAYQHTRFAPQWVPQRVREEGPEVANRHSLEALGPLVPNLSSRGLEWAEKLGGPREVFAEVARFIRSDAVQEIWAPAFGAAEELAVPDLSALAAPEESAPEAAAEGPPAKKLPPRPMPARRPIQTE
jgi:SAM-dependent methyltransferase